jgi:hypothetical protein
MATPSALNFSRGTSVWRLPLDILIVECNAIRVLGQHHQNVHHVASTFEISCIVGAICDFQVGSFSPRANGSRCSCTRQNTNSGHFGWYL